ncbi:MAG: hypothetical protein AAF298_14865 [Cyanobacteria bacterium P01_A01_bin.40]
MSPLLLVKQVSLDGIEWLCRANYSSPICTHVHLNCVAADVYWRKFNLVLYPDKRCSAREQYFIGLAELRKNGRQPSREELLDLMQRFDQYPAA